MWLYHSPDNPFPYHTAIHRREPSFPTRFLFEKNLIQGRILDFGCGHGRDVNFLKEQGFDVTGFDPHFQPDEPVGKFDTIICHYVLNVLLEEEQMYVIMAVSELLNPGGSAFFSVRRDLKKEGFRDHPIYGVSTYQNQVFLPFKSIKKAGHCQIYHYRHFALTQASPSAFFHPGPEGILLTETADVYAIGAPDIVNLPSHPGHSLILPKRPVEDFFELEFKEQKQCLIVLNRVKQILDERHRPEAYNVIINQGNEAGQRIKQAHIHLIPRYPSAPSTSSAPQ